MIIWHGFLDKLPQKSFAEHRNSSIVAFGKTFYFLTFKLTTSNPIASIVSRRQQKSCLP